MDTELTPIIQYKHEVDRHVSDEEQFNKEHPDHPRNFCYTCHRPLMPNYFVRLWNMRVLQLMYGWKPDVDLADLIVNHEHPMFDTQRCKDSAIRRHLPWKATPIKITDYHVEHGDEERIEFTNQHSADIVEKIAYDGAVEEHRNIVHKFVMEKIGEDAERSRQEREWNELRAVKPIPEKLRFEHTHILGPSGSGKTSLILDIILRDLNEDSPPAYIIIDPKGELVDQISRLAEFNNSWKDRLVIVDPLDSPALNVFQSSGRNPAQIISTFSYIFSTTRQTLTGKQDTCFAFCISLLFKISRSNLFTFLDLLDDRTVKDKPSDPQFTSTISNLTKHYEQAMRRFFEVDFYSPSYRSTRTEIKTRLWEVLKDEHLFAMLNATERRLDIAECIRDRKIVLVNTRMATLKIGHQTLGRYILSLAVDAIQSRVDIPEEEWHPVYLVIDEFQEFADEIKVPEMLRLIRVYKAGAILAHHNMYCTEFNDDIRTAISTNTSIKYATSPRGKDLNYVVRDFQCDPDFLTKECVKTDTHGRFDCYFTGLQYPFLHEFPFGHIDDFPKMSDDDYRLLRQANKDNLTALVPAETPSISPELPEADAPAEEPDGTKLW